MEERPPTFSLKPQKARRGTLLLFHGGVHYHTHTWQYSANPSRSEFMTKKVSFVDRIINAEYGYAVAKLVHDELIVNKRSAEVRRCGLHHVDGN